MFGQDCPPMIEVSIPSLEKEVDESGKLRKHFRVEVLFNGRKHFVLRRYSEFQNLHRKVKKILQAPDFPSKRSPHLRTKPLEQRRQELEDYVQDVLHQNSMVPKELLDFLQVKHFHLVNKSSSFGSLDDTQSQEYSCELMHQRVLGYTKDPYILESSSGLPDIIAEGVLQGLYPRDTRVSFEACTKTIAPAIATAAPPRRINKDGQAQLPHPRQT